MQVITLGDGRRLAYAETGPASGVPVIYCHGWPASRLEASVIPDLPARLIALDRPGYGGSDPKPGRRLADFPADVAALADHLGVARFWVVGVSGGAPYALACAQALDRVEGVALVSPIPPFAGPGAPSSSALGESLRRLSRLGTQPRLGRAVMATLRLGVRLGAIDPEQVLERSSAGLDGACLTPPVRRALVEAWREGLRRGVEGAASDARIYASPWGFEIAAMRAPVTIWHGAADRVVPVDTLPAYASLRARTNVLAGEGHYSVALTRSAEILAALLTDPDT